MQLYKLNYEGAAYFLPNMLVCRVTDTLCTGRGRQAQAGPFGTVLEESSRSDVMAFPKGICPGMTSMNRSRRSGNIV